MMNDNDNKDTSKSNPPPSQPSSNQKDPPPAETAANTNKNIGEDDKSKLDNKVDISGSINSSKPGAVAVNEGDSSKIKKKKEIRIKYNAPMHRHYPKNEEPGYNFMKEDRFLEQLEKIIAEDKASSAQSTDRAEVFLPGHHPINEEPGYSKMNKDKNQDKIKEKKVMGVSKATSPGAVAVEDAEDSNVKQKKKLRSQMIKRKATRESTTKITNDNENMESQVNNETTTLSPNVVRENDANNRKRRLKIKLGEHIRHRYATPMMNDTSDVQENIGESPALSSNETNVQANAAFANDEETHPIIPTLFNEEDAALEQERGIVNEDNDDYEIPVATAISDSKVVLVLPHAEPIDLAEDIVVVDAKAVVPWYKEKKFYAAASIIILITVVITSIVNNSANTNSSFTMPSFRPSLSTLPSLMPSSSPSLSVMPSSSPSLSPVPKALKDLYDSTSGDDWINKNGWFSSSLLWCSWYGVTCENNSDSIIEINLVSNNMQGSINSSISNLLSLRELRLTSNLLTGTIPTEVGLLSSLESVLYWNNNLLTGTIPSEVGLLSSLGRLSFYRNSLTGTIPTEVGLLSSLKELYLAYNSLIGTIPSEIGLLSSLESVLYINHNSLKGAIPSEIGLLSNLKYLYLHYNSLTGTIPTEVGLLSSLDMLYLSSNSLTGTIPSEIGLLSNLKYLILHNNSLTGTIPSEIGLLSNLDVLWLYYNSLTGTIPTEIGLLSNLFGLSFSINALTGTIPTEFGLLSDLEGLYLPGNLLTGTIPTEVGLLSNLNLLDLTDNNQMSGPIPIQVCNLSNSGSLSISISGTGITNTC